jgi:diketogulonate reductase-like aldo/keto reductase
MPQASLVHANGAAIPALGFGTWNLRDQECSEAVQWAIAAGYRHIDTASMYGNEEAVGAGLKGAGMSRDEVFVTTKVWHSDLKPADLQRSAETSLRRLGLSEVDLLLVHWPNADIPLGDTLRALSEAKRNGLTRHIGVSNFSPRLIAEAVRLASEPLVVNQCEYHPYLDQSRVRAACAEHGLAFTSYTPLGKGDVLKASVVREIATKHGKTPAQVILRWHVQQPGTIAIPKSANRGRIAENLDIFEFKLTDEDMRRISGLARPDGRMVRPGWSVDFDEAA